MPDDSASSHVVQEAAESTSFVNVKFPGEMANLALSNAVSFQQAMQGEMLKWSSASAAIHGKIAETIIEQKPSEIAGEAKILYGTPPTGFSGAGFLPATAPGGTATTG